ncbi:hypothetical protein B0H16DRAFT_1724102 [Mycena metata]|uniref:Uncharacterized protein n=1 Tax=Mycena metata TaxID=1033252 RepID=A0AAD7N8J5_9AGAR|nr:hypothetical protein B0H16DRAFT_1724102 [Mycena metata]
MANDLTSLRPRGPIKMLTSLRTQGKLSAQAHIEHAEGTWRELTDEVNPLAANLTTGD